jgi:hypothetical protein
MVSLRGPSYGTISAFMPSVKTETMKRRRLAKVEAIINNQRAARRPAWH